MAWPMEVHSSLSNDAAVSMTCMSTRYHHMYGNTHPGYALPAETWWRAQKTQLHAAPRSTSCRPVCLAPPRPATCCPAVRTTHWCSTAPAQECQLAAPQARSCFARASPAASTGGSPRSWRPRTVVEPWWILLCLGTQARQQCNCRRPKRTSHTARQHHHKR